MESDWGSEPFGALYQREAVLCPDLSYEETDILPLQGLLCDCIYGQSIMTRVILLFITCNINYGLFLPSDRSGQTEMLCRL